MYICIIIAVLRLLVRITFVLFCKSVQAMQMTLGWGYRYWLWEYLQEFQEYQLIIVHLCPAYAATVITWAGKAQGV